MAADGGQARGGAHPVLTGREVILRPGRPDDAPRLRAILAEPSVSRWWGEPEPVAAIEEDLRGGGSAVLLVVEVGGEVAGGIQYEEETDPMYRHAGIDVYLGTGSPSTRRRPTTRRSAATPRWASGRSGSCASTSAAPTAGSTTAC